MRSARFTPAAATVTRTSVAPGSGAGTSASTRASASPGTGIVMAFMAPTLGGGPRACSTTSRPVQVARRGPAPDPPGQLAGGDADPCGQRPALGLGHLVDRVGDRDPCDGMAGVVQHCGRHRGETRCHGPVLVRVALPAHPAELL